MERKFWSLVLFVGVMTGMMFSSRMLHAQSEVRRIEVIAKRFTFEPGEVTLKKGQPVVLVLKSTDVAHGLRFRELDLEVKVDKGGTVEIPLTPTTTGDFVGHCWVFCGSGHGAMALTLHVVE